MADEYVPPAGGEVTWQFLPWDELSKDQLYAVLALRCEVFVVEQECPYLDVDGLDPSCTHLLGTFGPEPGAGLAAYARVIPAGALHDHAASIGRIVTSTKARGRGLGQVMMAVILDHLREAGNTHPIEIEAQAHLERFYQGFGFRTISSAPFLVDNILHITMRRDPD
jgi:ElaA protein